MLGVQLYIKTDDTKLAMERHKCRQVVREEATSCTGRKEKATDPRAQESLLPHTSPSPQVSASGDAYAS
jgi:hypothetical protein